MNKTLFGLKTNKKFKIKYNTLTEKVELFGLDILDDIELSEQKAFNIPYSISICGVPFYPSKYEFVNGDVFYHNTFPPMDAIKFVNKLDILDERAKQVNVRLKPQDLLEFDKSSKLRPRNPSQAKIMGSSAKEHILKLVKDGKIQIPKGSEIYWHWCHLAAFTMLPVHRAQHTRNIVCGTSAFNGHMSNIEYAVKQLIYQTGRALSLEIQAIILANTHLARTMRYRVYDTKIGFLHTEYFDALTTSFSDHGDYEIIYDRMMSNYPSVRNKK